MGNATHDISRLRSLILDSQHLLTRSTDSIEQVVSDICGLQYDPYPAIHLNQYVMLWNRMQDFRPEQLDAAAYQKFHLVETWAFRRNMFLVPSSEYSLYKHATKGIERWGDSDESWLAKGDCAEIRVAEAELKQHLLDLEGKAARDIWEYLGLSHEWDQYRRKHDQSYNLPIFRAFYRMVRRGDLITCGRLPGTFKEPVYILREKTGLPDWTCNFINERTAIGYMVEKMIASLGVTDPVHVSHISGYRTSDILPIFHALESENKILRLPKRIGRKDYYVHASKAPQLNELPVPAQHEVRLITPMDTIVRDKAWLSTFFDYSFSFEYFKKKGMRWPLSILVGNQFVGWVDCKMDWKSKKFIIKEKTIFDHHFANYNAINIAIEELAAFHDATEIIEKNSL